MSSQDRPTDGPRTMGPRPHDPPPPGDEPNPSDNPNSPDQSTPLSIDLDLTNLLDGINADAGLPISVDASLDGDGTGGLLNLGGDGIDLALLGIDGDTDALINVGLEDGQGGATADVGSLINAAVLDLGGTGGIEVLAHSDVYDGNVPLVGDLSSALGATLDHLTTSSSLFDVPALDILCIDGLDT